MQVYLYRNKQYLLSKYIYSRVSFRSISKLSLTMNENQSTKSIKRKSNGNLLYSTRSLSYIMLRGKERGRGNEDAYIYWYLNLRAKGQKKCD